MMDPMSEVFEKATRLSPSLIAWFTMQLPLGQIVTFT